MSGARIDDHILSVIPANAGWVARYYGGVRRPIICWIYAEVSVGRRIVGIVPEGTGTATAESIEGFLGYGRHPM